MSAVVAACGSSGDTAADSSGSHNAQSACLITSESGVSDRSFNQQAWEAVTKAQKELHITGRNLSKSGSTDYQAIGEQFVQQGCSMIIGVGFDLAETIEQLAPANPDIKFVIIDNTLETKAANATSLTYATDQGSFLAGYLAAGMTKTKTVGIYGNEPIPPVELYMTGFVNGVNYYNKQKNTTVKVLGWNPKTKNGQFVGNFTDVSKGKLITESQLQQGADIIFPVAASIDQGTAAAISEAGGAAASKYMFWVDEDGCVVNPQYCGVMLSTVEKNISKSLFDVIKATVAGNFPTGSYVGDLKNDGVGLAPYHQLDSAVPAGLKAEIAKLREDIAAGTISVS
ncbi:MAG: BMP family ABC transporter substrate-binding protein [Gordonia sp. (in: high G+C Gram-positive bacteria)]